MINFKSFSIFVNGKEYRVIFIGSNWIEIWERSSQFYKNIIIIDLSEEKVSYLLDCEIPNQIRNLCDKLIFNKAFY